MKDNLQIPCSVFDFKTIRTEGFCHVDKTGCVPLLEHAERFLFFVRPRRFCREWFKSFKTAFDRIYMAGVSPVTMDDRQSNGGNADGAAPAQQPREGARLRP